ncbi:MAG: serine/threonine-protein kinase [Sarcina sp.]
MEEILEYEIGLYSEIKTILTGKVYVVEYEVTNQFYIKKILNKENLKAYENLKRIKCKHRAKIIECFVVDDNIIVIEELVNGRTIDNILKIEEISKEEAIRVSIGVCNGLVDIHMMENPIIHRDIKPSNVMINNDGTVKLIDFDAARVSNELNNRDTRLIGTQGYASPEQFGFAQTDIRSDIYSIGVLLNYMILKKFPTDEIVKGDIRQVIEKATQIDRAYRYQTIYELKEALGNVKLEGEIKEKVIDLNKQENNRSNMDRPKEDICFKNETKKEPRQANTFTKNFGKEKKSFWDKTIKKVVGFRSGNIIKMITAACWTL